MNFFQGVHQIRIECVLNCSVLVPVGMSLVFSQPIRNRWPLYDYTHSCLKPCGEKCEHEVGSITITLLSTLNIFQGVLLTPKPPLLLLYFR